eukprot:GHRQ01036953.1.p1 GENE.GHRQ01036953.1~~GHRQ01036953.1.p1  ORF type:complete len:202 (-),score=10.19 GHRQ01036953.1:178-783(-)
MPWPRRLARRCSAWDAVCMCRYAVSQRAQLLGQAAGLPPAMALFSFVGVSPTASATEPACNKATHFADVSSASEMAKCIGSRHLQHRVYGRESHPYCVACCAPGMQGTTALPLAACLLFTLHLCQEPVTRLLGNAGLVRPANPLGCPAGLAVTSATVVIYGVPVTDPVQLLSRMQQPLAVCVSLFGEGCSHFGGKCSWVWF